MLIKTRGIVLRVVKYGETSVIADVLTEEKGLHTFIVSGVRSPKPKISPGLLQVLSLVDVVAYFRAEKSMDRVKEISANVLYRSIPFDVRKMAISFFVAEVCQKTIRSTGENRLLFEFLHDTCCFLDDTGEQVGNFSIAFLVALSEYHGFRPDGRYSVLTPYFDLREGTFEKAIPPHPDYLDGEDGVLLDTFLRTPLQLCHTIRLTPEARRRLFHRLLDFYSLHSDNFSLRSHAVLESVFHA
jgi:DNA repair protein RecO (recombination protein O)